MSTDPHDGWTPQPQEQEQPREDYNASQRLAIGSDAPVTVVTAGPGSGKSHTIIGRILHGPVAPRLTTVVTFTTNAARVLKNRLKEQGAEVEFAGTVHSCLFRLIRKYHEKVGLGARIGILDADAAESLLLRTETEQRYHGTHAAVEDELKNGPPQHPKAPEQIVCAAYFRKMRESNVVDFDSIIRSGTALLHDQDVIAEWRGYSLCWDEAQDMSKQYFDVFNAMPAVLKFAVGDFDQSVFSFLGADSGMFAKMLKSDARVIHLQENYRCGSEICKASNALLASIPEHVETVSATGHSGTVELFDAGDEKKEALLIAKRANRLLAEKPEATIAVLVMTHEHRRGLENLLEGYGVPVERREDVSPPPDWGKVRPVLNALSDPDNVLFAEALVHAWRPDDADKIISSATASLMSLNDACLNLPYIETAKEAYDFIAAKQPSLESMKRLQDALGTLAENGAATVADLILALTEKAEEKEVVKSGKVRVMTFWASKGQEFDAVFTPALEEGMIPPASYTRTPELIAECRRVLYVGMTRARAHLYLSWAGTRRDMWSGRLRHQEASRYLKETGLL